MKVNRDKTLEQLDKQNWGEPTYNSYLVKTCYALRKKPIKDFSIEDLRLMIGQNINLEILIPIAMEKLKENILAEGDLYKGDLLKSVLTSDSSYWKNHQKEWRIVKGLYKLNNEIFNSDNIYRQIRKSFEVFQRINSI